MKSIPEMIEIFNETLTNEFRVRLLGETELQKEILQKVILLSKTIRLSTMFTTSGLRNIIDAFEKDRVFLNFIFDLTDVFILRIAETEINAEVVLIKKIAEAISYRSENPALCLFGNSFSNSFSSVEEIQTTLLNNRWLISIVLFRFINGTSTDELNKSFKKQTPTT